MTRRIINLWQTLDWWTVILYSLFIIAGCLNIYAASYDFDNASIFDFSERSGKQLTWVALAGFIALVVLLLDTRFYEDYANAFYLFMLVLLAVTIVIAPNIKGSHSWLVFGPISLQPAEFAKCTTALALAKFLNNGNGMLEHWKNLMIAFAIILAPMMLIIFQNEAGSALVYSTFLLMFYREGMTGIILLSVICAITFFIVGIKFSDVMIFSPEESAGFFYSELFLAIVVIAFMAWHFKEKSVAKVSFLIYAIALIIGVISHFFNPIKYTLLLTIAHCLVACYGIAVAFIYKYKRYILIPIIIFVSFGFSFSIDYIFHNVLKPHQRIRIEVTLGIQDDPRGVGYNVNQSKIAIGSGGFLGKGFLNGTQTKLKYVPEQDTDFIFCTIGEEWGFLGSFAVIASYLLFLIRLITLAERQRTVFARVYGYSVVSIIFFHLLVNLGMALGLTPVIGIPLPFFSYGGSSLWGFTILLFIFLRLDAGRLERF